MSDPQAASSSLRQAESLFLAYRDRCLAGRGEDFEALCSAHPDLGEALRLLHSAFRAGSTCSPASLRDVLQSRYGADAGEWLEHGDVAPASSRAGEAVDAAGRFVVKAEIGRGGTCRILEVWDHDLGRRVALKTPLDGPPGAPGALPSSATCERLLGEAHVTARLDHPAIVPIHDVGLDRDGRPYFTMRLVRGQDLGQVIALASRHEAGWSLTRAVRCLFQVCQAVAYAHAKGVVHRDLKPSNIMVGSLGEIYVMDWGLAKLANASDRHAVRLRFVPETPLTTVQSRRTGELSDDPLDPLVTPQGTVVGTPAFMPPEQARGEVEKANPSSDVYALGAILYTILARRPPYVPASGKGSTMAILSKVIEGPPARLAEIDPGIPTELIAICERAMARQQEDRHRDSLELAAALEDWLDRQVARPARAGGSRRGLAWTAALVGLVLLGVASQLFGPLSRPEVTHESVLADLQRVSQLESEYPRLWPAVTSRAGALQDWVERATSLQARVPAYEQALASHPVRSPGQPDRERSDLQALVERLRSPTSPVAPQGALAGVQRALDFARHSRQRTIEDAWPLWQEARLALSDRVRSPTYDGLALIPQEGLIPLGPDPRSGLWEFGHLATGRIPRRGRDGTLEADPGCALLLVLVPPSPEGEAFFLSREPITPEQQSRMAGPGERVETVLERLGMALPTDREWKRAIGSGEDAWRRADAPGARAAKQLEREATP